MSRHNLKHRLLNSITILIVSITISCIKNNSVKSKEISRDITHIISIKKNTEKIEIIRFHTNNKNELIITLKNNRKTDIKQNSLAIFKKGNKTGHLIKEGIKAEEEKTFKLNININKKQKNIFYIFLKQD
ncbi:hypothetical protein AB1O99_02400 [Borrelia hermsii]|uniref:Lipoprotein n=3 Tax=Borrelia hermsii TaxID=140 RepID=A0AAN1CEU0_BORHE|nr:hypothetical protein [Borrelia hermsii]AAX16984.1 hypothetical protein BH0475 [Borrelia hermsii DAH]AMR75370.1 hypothetical protein A0V01_01940 [Borrelia hermsii]ANA43282.1 hypothetical protein AXX13_02380 [Borrelia hermsii HS1]UEQ07116.1 hypothetical protein LEQ40_02395 [Borrelia hermsii]UPA07793.1 hypothetical protein bhDAH_000478 [Borrelia hermsii DAH]